MWNSTRVLAFFWLLAMFLVQNAFQYAFGTGFGWILALVLAFYALYEGPFFGAVAGVFAGLLLDLLGTGKLGFWTGVLAVDGVLVGLLARRLFRDSPLTHVLLAMASVFLCRLISVIAYAFSQDSFWQWMVLRQAFSLTEIILAAAGSFLIFPFLKKASRVRQTARRYPVYR